MTLTTRTAGITTANIIPQKNKYYPLYMDMARRTALESNAVRRKVGCVIITESGLMAIGWNGMPAGLSNICEWECGDGKGYKTGETKPEVIHAERNALDKLGREGVPARNAVVFVTCSPCIECAKSMHALGVREVWYDEEYRNLDGVEFLNKVGVHCKQWKDNVERANEVIPSPPQPPKEPQWQVSKEEFTQ